MHTYILAAAIGRESALREACLSHARYSTTKLYNILCVTLIIRRPARQLKRAIPG